MLFKHLSGHVYTYIYIHIRVYIYNMSLSRSFIVVAGARLIGVSTVKTLRPYPGLQKVSHAIVGRKCFTSIKCMVFLTRDEPTLIPLKKRQRVRDCIDASQESGFLPQISRCSCRSGGQTWSLIQRPCEALILQLQHACSRCVLTCQKSYHSYLPTVILK